MLFSIGISSIACKDQNDTNSQTIENIDSETAEKDGTDKTPTNATGEGFDINTIKISEEELGDFPYLKLPNGYLYADPDHSQNGNGKGLTVNLDKEYFLDNGIYIPIEGKTFKGHINLDRNLKDKAFAPLELKKSFDDWITKMGGVKINNGKGYTSGEKDRIKKLDPQAEPNGYLNSSQYYDNISTYVIRKADYNVWIQFNLGDETGYITVLKTN